MEISPDILPIILSNVITAAALGGVLWQKVTSIDEHTSERLEDIRGELQGLKMEASERNGRLGALERWKERREGFDKGYAAHEDEAKGG